MKETLVILLVIVFIVVLLFTSGALKPEESSNDSPTIEDLSPEERLVVGKVMNVATRDPEKNTIKFENITNEEWRNSCLGLEKEDELCAQVITPGYRVILEKDGSKLIYRTDKDAKAIRFENVGE